VTDLAVSSFGLNVVDEWDRQKHEPKRAFSAFQVYRDLGADGGDRSLAAVHAAGIPAGMALLLKWAEEFRWVERALAFDRYVDRRRVAAKMDEIEKMERRQVQTGQVLQARGLEYIQKELETEEQRAKRLTPTSALRFIDTGVALERQGLRMDDKAGAGDTNIQINVMDSGSKTAAFDEIDKMVATREVVVAMLESRRPVEDGIVDAEVVEDDAVD